MAIAFDSTGNNFSTSGTTSLSWNHTCTGSNLVLVVYVADQIDGQNPPSLSYNGTSMTLAGSSPNDAIGARSHMYYLANPSVGTHTVQLTASNNARWFGGSVSFSGADTTDPLDDVNFVESTSDTGLHPSVTTTRDNSFIVCGVGVADNTSGLSLDVGTLRWDQDGGFNGNAIGGTFQKVSAGTQSINSSWSPAARCSSGAIAIKEAPAASNPAALLLAQLI